MTLWPCMYLRSSVLPQPESILRPFAYMVFSASKSPAWPLPSPALPRWYRGAVRKKQLEVEEAGGTEALLRFFSPVHTVDGRISPLPPQLRGMEIMAEVLNAPSLPQSHMTMLPVLECIVYPSPSSVPRNSFHSTNFYSLWMLMSKHNIQYTTGKFPHHPVGVLLSFHMFLYNPIYSISPIYVQTLL